MRGSTFQHISPSMPKIHSIPLLFTGSFTVWGSFAIGDHLWYCTALVKHNHTNYKTNYQYQNQNLNLKISTTKAFS